MKKNFLFTSESLTDGHPDKLCDLISDSLVDHFLRLDPFSRIVTECAVSTSIVFVAARFDSDASVDVANIARTAIERVGYNPRTFNARNCSIVTSLRELSPDDYRRFDEATLTDQEIEAITVKNQVTLFGFACNQTPSLMPLPIFLAHQLARRLREVRLHGLLPFLDPDGKVQVGILYRDRRPVRIQSITIIASQGKASKPEPYIITEGLRAEVIEQVFRNEPLKPDRDTLFLINPDGPFVGGGPSAHSGMTGRKNAVDTYGGYARQSDAALSGKDPLRIDRVGAYAARHAAKNVVAAGLADECEVQLSYAVGLARPVSIQVETFGTGKVEDDALAALVERHFDFRLAGIVREFNLRRLPAAKPEGFYSRLAVYGHVGRTDMDLPWERIDKAERLSSS
jgi:S-adenosylmethionine synthetase